MTGLSATVQTSTPGELVTMFRLDTTSLGGPVAYFSQAATGGVGVTFQGNYYTPVDVAFTGFELNATGGLPTPKVKIANTNGVFQAMINTYGDLVGCKIQRIRTFAQYLDGGSAADPTAFYGPDMFRVERKVSENPVYIEWELSAALDNQGAMLPARVVIRDTCTWRYRIWNPISPSFDYTNVQCPYTGAMLTDADVTTTDGTLDGCSRTVNGCKARFGASAALPYGGFPGVARFR